MLYQGGGTAEWLEGGVVWPEGEACSVQRAAYIALHYNICGTFTVSNRTSSGLLQILYILGCRSGLTVLPIAILM
jgi:hypothetical protein